MYSGMRTRDLAGCRIIRRKPLRRASRKRTRFGKDERAEASLKQKKREKEKKILREKRREEKDELFGMHAIVA
jgi:hypothetical protein